ncbi:hypothetical protein LJC26_01070 [Desulfovibrio sp. OttesenSCG-928-O18]|nr:hypothetical protein [Desulfovibrio sp. OttesenSCG-928-O18]
MFIKTSLNLDIQTQYLDILRDFLDSEHKALQYGEIYNVYQLEQSIHGILKTVHNKRVELREELAGLTVKEYASELPQNLGDLLVRKIEMLDTLEQECMTKAARNADLSLVLAGKKMGVPEHWNVFPADPATEERVQ